MEDTYVDENGYLRFTNSDILLHRWAAEKKLGRKLRPGEVVHHKDRNKRNNSPENLWVFKNQMEHDRVHKLDASNHGRKASYKGFAQVKSDNKGCMFNLLMTFLIIFLSVTIISFRLPRIETVCASKCAPDKLYGNWNFIGMYTGRLTKIDTLKTNNRTSIYGAQNYTFDKSGTYTNDQGDYKIIGKFIIDNQNCIIKEFKENSERWDTIRLEITYLDNEHLLLVAQTDISSFSYFYKRKH